MPSPQEALDLLIHGVLLVAYWLKPSVIHY
jgi:hypothetical protein